MKIKVVSEITKLKKLLICSPGEEMENMLPNKRDEWLIDDIVNTPLMQQEYETFVKVLLLFLDPEKVLEEKNGNLNSLDFHKSECVIDIKYKLAQLFSDISNEKRTLALIEQVVSLEKLRLQRKIDLLKIYEEAKKEFLLNKEIIGSKFLSLVTTLISGKLEWCWNREEKKLKQLPMGDPDYIFKPIPNFIFTRDIGISVNDHFLISKMTKDIRHREVLLLKYITESFFFKSKKDQDEYEEVLEKLIDISEDDDAFQYDEEEMKVAKVHFEGGDMMMVSPRHLIVGKGQRTSTRAINKIIHAIFEKKCGIELISVVQIAEKRAQMHLDTVMTQVNSNIWMLYGRLSSHENDDKNILGNHFNSFVEESQEKLNTRLYAQNQYVHIFQFYCKEGSFDHKKMSDFYIYDGEKELNILSMSKTEKSEKMTYDKLPSDLMYVKPNTVESLLSQISKIEYGKHFSGNVQFVYSGNKQYPYDEREQWTDSSNVLSLGNGIVIGYDRNVKTAEAFCQIMDEMHGERIPKSNKALFDYSKNNREDQISPYCTTAKLLLRYVEENCKTMEDLKSFTEHLSDILVTIPSCELSRARGGSHCMSMPIERETVS